MLLVEAFLSVFSRVVILVRCVVVLCLTRELFVSIGFWGFVPDSVFFGLALIKGYTLH